MRISSVAFTLFACALVIASCRHPKNLASTPAAPKPVASPSLSGTQWRLEDLAGTGVVDRVQATLMFLDTGKVTGNASCNRFNGPVKIHEDTIQIGPLMSTKMACPEAVNNQETRYLQVLQNAERFKVEEPFLSIYTKGEEKPLRLIRMEKEESKP